MSCRSGPSAGPSAGGSSPAAAAWCSDCDRAAGAACLGGGHSCLDLLAARTAGVARLQAAQAMLRALDELEEQQGLRLTARAETRGEGDSKRADIGITLAVTSLASSERAALLRFLEGLDMYNEEAYLHCSPERDDVMVGLCRRLPTRVEGATVRAGAILLRWKEDGGKELEDAEEMEGWEDDEVDDEKREARDDAWQHGVWQVRLGWQDSNDLRIYYDDPVKPHQAKGAKILGYVTKNLKEIFGSAKPGCLYHLSGWGTRYDEAMGVDFSDVVWGTGCWNIKNASDDASVRALMRKEA